MRCWQQLDRDETHLKVRDDLKVFLKLISHSEAPCAVMWMFHLIPVAIFLRPFCVSYVICLTHCGLYKMFVWGEFGCIIKTVCFDQATTINCRIISRVRHCQIISKWIKTKISWWNGWCSNVSNKFCLNMSDSSQQLHSQPSLFMGLSPIWSKKCHTFVLSTVTRSTRFLIADWKRQVLGK